MHNTDLYAFHNVNLDVSSEIPYLTLFSEQKYAEAVKLNTFNAHNNSY